MATTVSFLFWNIRRAAGTRFYESLRRLAVRDIDIFIFAEPPAVDAELLEALNGGTSHHYYRVPSESQRLMLFSRLHATAWSDYFLGDASERYTAHTVRIGTSPDFLLIGTHLHAPNNLDQNDRAEWARRLVADIRSIEDQIGHTRTALVGDLNMNPFDRGLVDTTALHALMSRSLTRSIHRFKSRRKHLPFYNPMWSLLGDRGSLDQVSRRPSGTYFYDNSQAMAGHFWQMFDQVLLRPALMDSLTNLEILDSDGQDSLLTPLDRPNRSAIADHLPLYFELALPTGA